MIDDFARDYLHGEIRDVREALAGKLEGLSEYDIRRPLTATGTNLLGLVKHRATSEARYLGEVFGRPFPEPLPRWQDSDGSDFWATPTESRAQILGFYRRAATHADATITALPLDAPGHVPWWPRPDVRLFGIMVHVLNDTTRHAGHADILREQLDGRTGSSAERIDTAAREAHWTMIERAARAATQGP
ncbi:DinB family protein [Actinoplanes sp. NPDC049596]|uniref:DinB family protein n=1 Tax=unclassified Actinoplanes TaxID=2626549 RepID=UPI003435E1B6